MLQVSVPFCFPAPWLCGARAGPRVRAGERVCHPAARRAVGTVWAALGAPASSAEWGPVVGGERLQSEGRPGLWVFIHISLVTDGMTHFSSRRLSLFFSRLCRHLTD